MSLQLRTADAAASPPLWSQESGADKQTLPPLAPEIAADFDERLGLVIAKRGDAARIEAQLIGADGLLAQVVTARLGENITERLEKKAV